MNVRVLAILGGGGILVFLLYRYLQQRQSAATVTRGGAPTLKQRIDNAYRLDAWAQTFGNWWVDQLNKQPPVDPTAYTPTPPTNAPPMEPQPPCGAGMRWDPQFGICVSSYS